MTTETDLEQIPAAEIETEKTVNNGPRNRKLWFFSGLLLIAGIIWLLIYFFYLQYYESTDDAYVNGNMININSAIQGSVIAFYADDTDLVTEGQLLVELDKTDYQVKYEQSLAALAATVLQVRQIYDNVTANQANLESRLIALSRAEYDYNNRSNLVGTEAVSKEDFTHSKDDLSTAKMALKQAKAQLAAAVAAAGNTPLEQHPMLMQAKANVRESYYNLAHTSIYAPYTGYVAQRTVNVGQWVTPTTPLMAVIPIDYVWVDANFKETQLAYMRIGQPTTVWFDLYGSHIKYTGKVLGIASGSGSVFSLIPPQNATGNWIKIVQRLPVRISLDPEQLKNFPARLGISAEVTVDITNQDLPKLAQEPIKRSVATTSVFDLEWDRLEKTIEQIVQDNMNKNET
ncbi:MAG: multidrug transporter [Chlamydiales bacterium 38-26]|nr:efflux RND transporter periplasmic adaptor subunit [Chlamydiales bacterium]OJV09398.1 MAG: multidrug transporter [Chlamydiales bacterium 38-26]